MRISTKLRLAALVPAVMALVTILGVVYAYSPIVELQRRQSDIIRLRADLNTLNDLARSYVTYHDVRSRDQFLDQIDTILREVERASTDESMDQRRVTALSDNVSITRSLFVKIIENHEMSLDAPAPVRVEAEQRLSAQLFIRSTAASDIIGHVVRSLSADIVRSQQKVSLLITVFTSIAAVVLTIGALRLRRGITRSLGAISAGTRAVGGGDLGYRIRLKTGDELADLARSFDAMTERLNGVTVSKSELEAEVEERTRVEEELRQALATTQVLLEAADTLSASMSPEGVLEALAGVLSRATGRPRVLISLYDVERNESVVTTGTETVVPKGTRFSIDDLAPATRRVFEERRPTVIDYETPDVPALSRQRAEQLGYRLVLVVPLLLGDRVLGYFSVDEPGVRREFTERDIEIARGIASQAAVAIENARLYEAERGIADRLQGALLALPDELPGIQFAHAYHSAAEQARVGGDFYDLFLLDENTLGITIGDVAGKGLDAAVLTSLTKNTIRAHASESDKTPAQILALTNDVIYKSTPAEAFVTVFFGVLDVRDGTLTYVNAGHTSSVIVCEDQSLEPLQATAPLLGAFPGVSMGESRVCNVPRDAILFLYTDGLTEARRGPELFGEDRLFELLRMVADGGPANLVRAVIEEVGRFTGGLLNDDLAMLAVKRLENEDEGASRLGLEM